MDPLHTLALDVLQILGVGFIVGAICKRVGLSTLVGYLLAGVLLGGAHVLDHEAGVIEYLAEGGVLLLLFSIGIELSVEELIRLRRFFFVGGGLQMLLVGAPVGLIAAAAGLSWQTAALIGAALSFSSTVLVFRALAEWGEADSENGRRAISILLFQDVALAPLLLLIPLITGEETSLSGWEIAALVGSAAGLVAAVAIGRRAMIQWIGPRLTELRSTELVVLFILALLVGFTLAASLAGLTPALGALAAGLVLSGGRMSHQIDALILPYRESFAAIFFVSLGALIEPTTLIQDPLLLTGGFLAVLVWKAAAAALALRATGLRWRSAVGMGMGLSQVGEFAFVMLYTGVSAGLLSEQNYGRLLFIALATILITPQLMKWGLQIAQQDEAGAAAALAPEPSPEPSRAIVIGAGLIGRHMASQLEMLGVDACIIDLSPVNLHLFASSGFRTLAGDAREEALLQRANIDSSQLVVVSVPDDDITQQVTQTVRSLNPRCTILVRCRYETNAARLRTMGSVVTVSEETQASEALQRALHQAIGKQGATSEASDVV